MVRCIPLGEEARFPNFEGKRLYPGDYQAFLSRLPGRHGAWGNPDAANFNPIYNSLLPFPNVAAAHAIAKHAWSLSLLLS